MTFEQITEILSCKKVGIAGCGGLGSNCAVALARVGVGTLILVDFDVVSQENLNRQYFFSDQVGMKKVQAMVENLRRTGSKVQVVPYDIKLSPENVVALFEGCDLVVEALDGADQKKMFIETILTGLPSVPLITGLGIAGWGNNSSIQIRKSENLYICGDGESEVGPEMPPLAPRVGIVANMQANMALEIFLG